MLEAVNLKDKADCLVQTYSGGMKRRLNIALALVQNPSILFLDEPTVGLDPKIRRDLWGLIEKLKKRGMTIILTTHYMDEAENLCDRMGIMYEGKLVAEGQLSEIKEKSGLEEGSILEDVYLSVTADREV